MAKSGTVSGNKLTNLKSFFKKVALSFGSVIFYLYLYQKLEDMNQITKIFSDLTNGEILKIIRGHDE